MAGKTLSKEDEQFLAQCEEEFKDRFTENDEEFMKVYNSEPSKPPIIENWWTPNNSGRRNDRRFNRRHHPYERHGRDRGFQDRRHNYDRGFDRRDNHDSRGYNDRRDNHDSRGYNDYQGFDGGQRSRY